LGGWLGRERLRARDGEVAREGEIGAGKCSAVKRQIVAGYDVARDVGGGEVGDAVDSDVGERSAGD
jgi:hypothetical protein